MIGFPLCHFEGGTRPSNPAEADKELRFLASLEMINLDLILKEDDPILKVPPVSSLYNG